MKQTERWEPSQLPFVTIGNEASGAQGIRAKVTIIAKMDTMQKGKDGMHHTLCCWANLK
jgi:hypothetical protein